MREFVKDNKRNESLPKQEVTSTVVMGFRVERECLAVTDAEFMKFYNKDPSKLRSKTPDGTILSAGVPPRIYHRIISRVILHCIVYRTFFASG